jgi:hypothetical protein
MDGPMLSAIEAADLRAEVDAYRVGDAPPALPPPDLRLPLLLAAAMMQLPNPHRLRPLMNASRLLFLLPLTSAPWRPLKRRLLQP